MHQNSQNIKKFAKEQWLIPGFAVAEANYNFFATGREHMNHCTWMLTRMAHVYTHPGLCRDFLVSNFAPAKHCILFLLDRALESPGDDEILSTGNVGFGSC